eukprot:2052302-Amphidinium_carterae.1
MHGAVQMGNTSNLDDIRLGAALSHAYRWECGRCKASCSTRCLHVAADWCFVVRCMIRLQYQDCVSVALKSSTEPLVVPLDTYHSCPYHQDVLLMHSNIPAQDCDFCVKNGWWCKASFSAVLLRCM